MRPLDTGTMLFAKAPCVVQPRRVDFARAGMHQRYVCDHPNAKTRKVASETEIRVIAMPTIKGYRIERHAARHLGTRRDPNAVKGLHAAHLRRGHAKELHVQDIVFGLCQDATRAGKTGMRPAHPRQYGRTGNAEDIEGCEVVFDALAKLLAGQFHVIVRKHDVSTTGTLQPAIVAFA